MLILVRLRSLCGMVLAGTALSFCAADTASASCIEKNNEAFVLRPGETYLNGKLNLQLRAINRYDETVTLRSNLPGWNGTWKVGLQDHLSLSASHSNLCGSEVALSCRYELYGPGGNRVDARLECRVSQF